MAQANSGEFLSPEARLAFSDGLFEKRSLDGVKFSYGATLIFPKKDAILLMEPVLKVVRMKWGEKGHHDFDKGLIKNPVFKGDAKEAHSKQSGELWSGFGPEVIFIRANAQEDAPPRILYRSRHIDATREEVYSGCFGRAVLNAYTWEHPQGGRGVSFGIRSFQKVRDGESLGGRAPLNVDKWFVEVPDDDDESGGSTPPVDIFS
jgi:hypothetical protein